MHYRMKKDAIISLLGSRTLTLATMLLYGIWLGGATFVEAESGKAAAESMYYSPLVGVLWLLMVANWAGHLLQGKVMLRRKWGHGVLHTAFVWMLSGATITHFSCVEGTLHLREGEQTDVIITPRHTTVRLPFQVCLNDFQLVRYAGSNSPRSYKSAITIIEGDTRTDREVAMNKVISVQGYRLFQTAYDADEAGTFLTVSYDLVGMPVTYAGYAMLFVGLLLLPFQRGSRFRTLLDKLKWLSVFLLLPLGEVQAQADWGRLQVQNPNGRIEPLDTYCRTLTRKIHHSETVNDVGAVDFILGLMREPAYWNAQPILYQPNEEIQESLGKQGRFVSPDDLMDAEGRYVLQEEIDRIYHTPSQLLDKRQKDLLKLDERLNILLSIQQGGMLRLLPLPDAEQQRRLSSEADGFVFVETDEPPMSDVQVSLELLYNRLKPFSVAAFAYLGVGLLLLLMVFFLLGHRPHPMLQRAGCCLVGIIFLSFVVHTAGLMVRWYIGGQAPWSNAYESMVYAAWCTLGGSLLFARRSQITLALGAFFAGVLLLVSHLNWMDPVITPLVPVLQSYWLMIHVAVIMSGYGFFFISFLLGLVSLVLMLLPHPSLQINQKIEEMAIVNEICLILGLCLMTAGTFLGAIWANEAWGRYWGWDPKETWALITILTYAAITHARILPKWNRPFVLSTMSVFGFSTVLMTYLGVNCFFGGMHSYGNAHAPLEVWVFAVLYLCILLICILAYLRLNGNRNG